MERMQMKVRRKLLGENRAKPHTKGEERLSGNLFLKKIKSRSGESIAETLVAVLIAALALLLLAGTINTASNMITKSKDLLDTYYTANNNLALEKTKIGTLTVTMQDDAGISVSESWSVNYYQPAYDDDADTLGDTDYMMSYSIASTEETEADSIASTEETETEE